MPPARRRSVRSTSPTFVRGQLGDDHAASRSTSARETSFRPPVSIADQQTLVMCDQLATVDLTRLTEAAGFLSVEDMQRVDEALTLALDL
ncbi:MAG: hypothetical protein DLM57_16060 [Pseudonocardiales bacterium]|nr:MAG: hypothetical protein DLM57_16060 [Pseudonocardiales bacterium]